MIVIGLTGAYHHAMNVHGYCVAYRVHVAIDRRLFQAANDDYAWS